VAAARARNPAAGADAVAKDAVGFFLDARPLEGGAGPAGSDRLDDDPAAVRRTAVRRDDAVGDVELGGHAGRRRELDADAVAHRAAVPVGDDAVLDEQRRAVAEPYADGARQHAVEGEVA